MKALLLEWFSKAARVVGVDAESLRNMNKALKWSGLALVIIIALALVLEPPQSPERKLVDEAAHEQQSTKPPADGGVKPNELVKSITSTLGWISVACFALAAFIEPKEPKRDRRFKTGFKNNATVRRKSPSEVRVQVVAITIGAIAGAIWHFLR